MSYGKLFSSCYTGSMFGAGTDVFAVWGYVIAHAVDGQVEINPKLVAAVLGTSVDTVNSAVGFLCSPDPSSRNKQDEGRRLVKEGEFAYRVVSHSIYREMRNEDERREYNRIKQAEHRRKKAEIGQPTTDSPPVSLTVNDKSTVSAMSAKAEAEAEAEAKAEAKAISKDKEIEASLPFSLSQKPSKKPAGEHRQMLDAWCDAYFATHGSKFVVTSRDAKAAKELLASGVKPDDVASLAKAAWANRSKDAWNCQNRTATLYDFADAFMKIKQEVGKAGGTSSSPVGGEFCDGWWNKDPKHMTSKEISAYVDR